MHTHVHAWLHIASYMPLCEIMNIHLLSLVALVNKGNCLFSSGQYDKARDYYQEAPRFVHNFM